MTSPTGASARHDESFVAGTVALALGVLFTAAVVFASALSLVDAFNPPTWIRIVGLVWLPLGLGGVPIAYYLARTGNGRARARLGVLVAVVGLLVFVALVIAVG